MSTPAGAKNRWRYLPGFFSEVDDVDQTGARMVGSLVYSNGAASRILVPTEVQESYQVSLELQQSVPGIFIPSHRSIFAYQRVETIPTTLSAREQLLDTYLSESRTRFAGGSSQRTASARLKESLISLATFGYGNEAVEPNSGAAATFEGFERLLGIVLPKSIKFHRLAVRMPEIVLETGTGTFSFDAVSGGVAAIIDLTWQLYLCSLVYQDFVVVIDEPENHLHPQLSRTLLPSLLEAFETAQFIVATHNPFMVSSVPTAQVYALAFNNEGRVVSQELDLENKAASSSDILRDVLGVPSTLPAWVDSAVQSAVDRLENQPLSDEGLSSLKDEMDRLGLGHLFPQTLSEIADRQDDQAN